MSDAIVHISQYTILGPQLKRDNGVLEAVYSLYYLPVQYVLLLPFTPGEDTDFRTEVQALIKKNALDKRVQLIESRAPSVTPEAFASAVLHDGRLYE